MKLQTLAAIALGSATLAGCIIIDGHDEDDGPGRSFHMQTQWGIPDLEAVNVGANSLTARVPGECASKDTVGAFVDQDGKNHYEISVEYLNEGVCNEDAPGARDITWTYDALDIPAGATVRVINKVAG